MAATRKVSHRFKWNLSPWCWNSTIPSLADSWARACRRLGLMAGIGRLLFQTFTAVLGLQLSFVFPLSFWPVPLCQCDVHQYMQRCMTEWGRGGGGDEEVTCWLRRNPPTAANPRHPQIRVWPLLSCSERLHGWVVKQVHRCVTLLEHTVQNPPAFISFNSRCLRSTSFGCSPKMHHLGRTELVSVQVTASNSHANS